jgi:SAM-dependent methyltransferase
VELSEPILEPLIALGKQLRRDGYCFITPTPATHARILQRGPSSTLRDIFGWNRSFDAAALPAAYRPLLKDPALFAVEDDGLRSRVRFSTLGDLLIAHSGFPTVDPDAVFFGPDTYRFCRAITWAQRADPAFQPRRVFDIGAGSGAGGLHAARSYSSLSQIVLCDINPRALGFARANAVLNGLGHAQTCLSDILAGVERDADLIISNPPYLVDPLHRTYRDGGGPWGDLLALRILDQALPRLTPAGRLLLYTGSAIVEGRDTFHAAARPILKRSARDYRYEEVDPDVFGEELESPPYHQADRIAAVVLEVRGDDLLPGAR